MNLTQAIAQADAALARYESMNATDPFYSPLNDHMYVALRGLVDALAEADDTVEFPMRNGMTGIDHEVTWYERTDKPYEGPVSKVKLDPEPYASTTFTHDGPVLRAAMETDTCPYFWPRDGYEKNRRYY